MASPSFEQVSHLFSMYMHFLRQENGKLSKFLMLYVDMVEILLELLNASRDGHWKLNLSSISKIVPWYFVYDKPNNASYFLHICMKCHIYQKGTGKPSLLANWRIIHSDWSQQHFYSCKNKAWKHSAFPGLEPCPLRYLCSALTNWTNKPAKSWSLNWFLKWVFEMGKSSSRSLSF